MSTDPDQIRREIEVTRNSLSSDVDALSYKVSPSRIVDDRKRRAQGAVRKVRDTVMGTASDLGDATGHAASSVSHHASSAVAGVGDAASQAPAKLREKSEGNPLAAGLIAFGVGWLASSLIPSTRREQRAATQVREKAAEHGGPVGEKLGEVAHEVKENLREPAQYAAESVRSTASDAVRTVKDDGRAAAHDVRDHTRDRVTS